MFGPKGGMKLIGHMKGFDDLSTGIQYPNQCIVHTLMGVDYVPSFSGEKSLDERAKREIQGAEINLIEQENELIESAKLARKENMINEALDYEKQLKDTQRKLTNIQEPLKGDFISAKLVKRLYAGDILIAFTNRARGRKRRMLKMFKDEGFEEEAADLKRSFDVGDKSIVFFNDASAFEWVLKPYED